MAEVRADAREAERAPTAGLRRAAPGCAARLGPMRCARSPGWPRWSWSSPPRRLRDRQRRLGRRRQHDHVVAGHAPGVTAKWSAKATAATCTWPTSHQLPETGCSRPGFSATGEVEPVQALFVPDQRRQRLDDDRRHGRRRTGDGHDRAERRQRGSRPRRRSSRRRSRSSGAAARLAAVAVEERTSCSGIAARGGGAGSARTETVSATLRLTSCLPSAEAIVTRSSSELSSLPSRPGSSPAPLGSAAAPRPRSRSAGR